MSDEIKTTEQVKGRIDVRRLQGMRQEMLKSLTVTIGSGELGVLIDAYIERGALILVNHAMETQGADIAPYWAHHAMARALSKEPCSAFKNIDRCSTAGGMCITEYCPQCYAKVWWESQHKHKAQKARERKSKP